MPGWEQTVQVVTAPRLKATGKVKWIVVNAGSRIHALHKPVAKNSVLTLCGLYKANLEVNSKAVSADKARCKKCCQSLGCAPGFGPI